MTHVNEVNQEEGFELGKMPLAFGAKQNDFGSMNSPTSDMYPGLQHRNYFVH